MNSLAGLWFTCCFLLLLLEKLLLLHLVVDQLLVEKELLLCDKEIVVRRRSVIQMCLNFPIVFLRGCSRNSLNLPESCRFKVLNLRIVRWLLNMRR